MFAVSRAANNYCAILAVYMEYMCVCHHGLASPAMVGGWVYDSCLMPHAKVWMFLIGRWPGLVPCDSTTRSFLEGSCG